MSEKILTSTEGGVGFRGTHYLTGYPKLARIQVIIEKPCPNVLLFDIPADCLPYIPDQSEGSEFQRAGLWHFYKGIMEIRFNEQKIITSVSLSGENIYNGCLTRFRSVA